MANLNLICKDCGRSFYVTDKEQAFYSEKGYEMPKRCYGCRQANKQRKAGEGK